MHAFLLKQNSNDEELINSIVQEQGAQRLPFSLQKIEDVRELKKLTNLSFSRKTAIVIKNIEQMSPEAQNAFLKSLEEPQKNLIYILCTANIQAVLPTVISRCELIKSTHQTTVESTSDYPEIQTFLSSDVDYKLDYISKIKDRSLAVEFVTKIIKHQRLKGEYQYLEDCLETLKNLKANGNVPLQLTNLIVKMIRHGR